MNVWCTETETETCSYHDHIAWHVAWHVVSHHIILDSKYEVLFYCFIVVSVSYEVCTQTERNFEGRKESHILLNQNQDQIQTPNSFFLFFL